MFFKMLMYRIFTAHKWQRGFLMLFFIFVKAVLSWIINFIALFQFLHTLLTDAPNARVMIVAQILNRFLYQIVTYLSYANESAPFPFNELNN